ncbi:Putative HMP/thiamine import ATP-binding protein YkoD [Corynebacterium occultum]|uniref:HMP/thiamine import ATP-binding protein YkoD n=1 Tax=Corynebacterium occultum TaxID=2675219 RepID=A0A6B8W6M9_9CORY|nr:ABC transporter ATP-binding protein [Corynebacterium occultum]QGU06975.1 Putative HMP/thiamine import ATP-binding protein YkoD [Corynebacterium occultum]
MTRNLLGGAAVRAHDFGWRHASRRDPALQGVNLDIAPGQRVLLTGNSGSGKSTLLSALGGVLGDSEEGESRGTLLIDAADTPTVGMVLQDPDSQVIASRIGDDVAFGCENLRAPREEIWPRVERALELVGLELPLNHPTAHLSGGQKQRLALAGVMAMGANLILLDEPTANLDPQGQREVVAAVEQVVAQTGATLIVIEHRHELWLPVVDTILRLSDGQIQEISAAELPGAPLLEPARPERAQAPALISAHDLLTQWGPPRTLRVPSGASTVITGPNGAGKSTLALTLAGLLPPRQGHLELAEELRQGLRTPPHKWRSAALAQRIGLVFQDPEHQFLARTVAEELAIGPKVMKLGDASGRSAELLHRLRLSHLAQANPFTLSGGEKRRLSVATALVAAPKLLVLDEPTFGQDPETFRELVSLLRELSDQGTTILSVTHDPAFIATLGDHRVEVS